MIKFGRAKHSSKVTVDDHLKHLIWTSAHDERHDEEWEKPIVSTQEVTREIVDSDLIVPIITIQVAGTEIYGTGWYLHRDSSLFAIALWHEGQWKTLDDAKVVEAGAILVSVPKLLGQEHVRFICNDLRNCRAQREP